MQSLAEQGTMYYASPLAASHGGYKMEQDWAGTPSMGMKMEQDWTSPSSAGGSMSRSASVADELSMLAMGDGYLASQQQLVNPATYAPAVSWTPSTDPAIVQYADSSTLQTHMTAPLPRSQSFDTSMMTAQATPWAELPQDFGSYGRSQGPTQASTPASMKYFPSPSSTPCIRPIPTKSKSTPSSSASGSGSGSCTCFSLCLQSLQALHNASSPACPPLDEVLNLNSKAVECCRTMLACTRCMSRSGTHTATMLLATVIGKITSFYKAASNQFDDNSGVSQQHQAAAAALNNPSLSLGGYQMNTNEGRRFELEILALELRKLEELYMRFTEVCADFSEDQEVSKAMVGYLGQNLVSTIKQVNQRKGNMGYM